MGDRGERLNSAGRMLGIWRCIGFAALAPVSIALSQMCAGLTALGVVLSFSSGRVRSRFTGLEAPLAAFLLAEVLATIHAVNRRWSVNALEDDWPLLLVPLFGLALRDSRDVRLAFLVLLGSSSIVSVLAIWQFVTGWDFVRHRALESIGHDFIATGFFGHHLTFGGVVLISSTLALGLLAAAPTRRWAGTTLLMMAGLVASFARTAWLGAAAAVLTAAALSRGAMRWLWMALLPAGALAALALSPVRERLTAFLGFGDDSRVRLWATALRIWKAHPVLGAGPGSFRLLFEQYKVPGVYKSTVHPHNDFLKVLLNAGAVGLVALASIWILYFRGVIQARRHAPAGDPRRPILQAGIVVVTAFLIAATGQCFLSDETVTDLFWFVVAGVLVSAGDTADQGRAGA